MRGFVARFNFSCTLIGDSPAIPYWPYRRTLCAMVKNETASKMTAIKKHKEPIKIELYV